MGRIAIQLVKAAGALVLAAASSHERLRDARAHGADAVVLAEPSTLLERIYALTEGAGCDVVIDGVGGDLFAPSLNALKAHGRYVVSMHACSAWGSPHSPQSPKGRPNRLAQRDRADSDIPHLNPPNRGSSSYG